MRSRALVLAVLVGCGGRYGGPAAPTTPAAKPAAHGIESAALPYDIVDPRTGHSVDPGAFWDKLGKERAVCVGEEHPNPHHHWVQLEVVRHLVKAWPQLALGMEMFQRPFQGVLDDYAARKIDADTLRSRTGWEERWGYDWDLYAPTIAVAVDAHGALLALNAPKELTKKIAHHGLESLTPDERAQVPELKLDDAQHRAWFDQTMEDMGGTAAHSAPKESGNGAKQADTDMPSADRIYTVQVTWDETMADTAAKWLRAHPQGHIVILAGNGHCHDSAIVNRIKRRGITEVVSIRSVVDDGQGAVSEVLAKPQNDFVVVLKPPADAKTALR